MLLTFICPMRPLLSHYGRLMVRSKVEVSSLAKHHMWTQHNRNTQSYLLWFGVLASMSVDSSLFWEVLSGKPCRSLIGHSSSIKFCTSSHDTFLPHLVCCRLSCHSVILLEVTRTFTGLDGTFECWTPNMDLLLMEEILQHLEWLKSYK